MTSKLCMRISYDVIGIYFITTATSLFTFYFWHSNPNQNRIECQLCCVVLFLWLWCFRFDWVPKIGGTSLSIFTGGTWNIWGYLHPNYVPCCLDCLDFLCSQTSGNPVNVISIFFCSEQDNLLYRKSGF